MSTISLSRELPGQPGMAIAIECGTENFRTGSILLRVRGDGTATVRQRIAGETHAFEGRLDRARVEEFATELDESGFTEPRVSDLPRQPGDVPLHLRVERDGESTFDAELWHGDRYADAGLDRIVRVYDEVVEELTGGALPFGPR